MYELKIFENQEFGKIRAVEIDGEPWLVGKDVAEALGYKNTRQAIATNVDEEDRGVHSVDTPSGVQEMTVINESGLYSLVLSSKLPTAKKFKRWVTSEVLPSIRRTGGYILPRDYPSALRALADSEERRMALEVENAQQRQMLAEYNPKVSYYDIVLQTPDVLPITTIAKDYGKSGRWMNQKLHELGVQYKQGKVWLLYQEYAEQGYTKTKTETYLDRDGAEHSTVHTYWTQKGRLFLYDLLKEHGIVPLIEMEAA